MLQLHMALAAHARLYRALQQLTCCTWSTRSIGCSSRCILRSLCIHRQLPELSHRRLIPRHRGSRGPTCFVTGGSVRCRSRTRLSITVPPARSGIAHALLQSPVVFLIPAKARIDLTSSIAAFLQGCGCRCRSAILLLSLWIPSLDSILKTLESVDLDHMNEDLGRIHVQIGQSSQEISSDLGSVAACVGDCCAAPLGVADAADDSLPIGSALGDVRRRLVADHHRRYGLHATLPSPFAPVRRLRK